MLLNKGASDAASRTRSQAPWNGRGLEQGGLATARSARLSPRGGGVKNKVIPWPLFFSSCDGRLVIGLGKSVRVELAPSTREVCGAIAKSIRCAVRARRSVLVISDVEAVVSASSK